MTRPIPPQTVDFIAEHEAFRAVAYDDLQPNRRVFASVADVKGRATIGYGHTRTVGNADVVARKRISQQQARILLNTDLRDAVAKLAGVVRADVIEDLTANQYAALLSFVFNLGANSSWTIWKRLNARQFDAVPGQMARFVNAGGKKLQGLVNRRNAEIALWSREEPGSVQLAVSSGMTRTTPTPPTPEVTTPAAKDSVAVGGMLAGLGGIGGIAAVAQPILQGIASPWAFAAFALVAIGVFLVLTGRLKVKVN